jgi:hypothetical protein
VSDDDKYPLTAETLMGALNESLQGVGPEQVPVGFDALYDKAVDVSDEDFRSWCRAIYDSARRAPVMADGGARLVAAVSSLAVLIAAVDERIERRMRVHLTDDPHVYPDGSTS